MREQAILDNAGDVICSIDAKYRFAGVGASAEKCWNRLEIDLLGAPVVAILDDDSRRFQKNCHQGHWRI